MLVTLFESFFLLICTNAINVVFSLYEHPSSTAYSVASSVTNSGVGGFNDVEIQPTYATVTNHNGITAATNLNGHGHRELTLSAADARSLSFHSQNTPFPPLESLLQFPSVTHQSDV